MKQYSIVFPPGVNSSKPKRVEPKCRSNTGKSKVAEVKVGTEGSSVCNPAVIFTKPADVSRGRGRKVISLSRKKSEVLGDLNGRNASVERKAPEEFSGKREKRKRYGVDDIAEIAAENIPVERVFPALQFGTVHEVCPVKRRRLQSLISPQSPDKRFIIGNNNNK